MHAQDPSITQLQVHLPGQYMVIFDPEEPPQDILDHTAAEQTMLIVFFRTNADNGPLGEQAQALTYQEFPQKFMWVHQPQPG